MCEGKGEQKATCVCCGAVVPAWIEAKAGPLCRACERGPQWPKPTPLRWQAGPTETMLRQDNDSVYVYADCKVRHDWRSNKWSCGEYQQAYDAGYQMNPPHMVYVTMTDAFGEETGYALRVGETGEFISQSTGRSIVFKVTGVVHDYSDGCLTTAPHQAHNLTGGDDGYRNPGA